MSAYVEHKLCNILRNTEFNLQLNESTLLSNESLLFGFVRFVHNGVLCEELAIALSLNTDTRGETVFQEVKTYFETNAIPLTNVIACATDGAPSMISRYRGFNAFLKSENPNVIICHCVIDRQHLWPKILVVVLTSPWRLLSRQLIKSKPTHYAHAYSSNCAMKMMKPLSANYFISKYDGFQKETTLHVLTCFLILSWNFCRVAILVCCCYCCLPDPFRGMGAWRKTMEPQKPGNSPGSGPEVVKR